MSSPSAPANRTPPPSSAPARPRGQPLGLRTVIVGAGVAGLTAARALLDAGADVTVFERRSLEEALDGPAGLGLHRNAMSALRMLSGAGEASLSHDVAAAGVRETSTCLFTVAGKPLTRVPEDHSPPGLPPQPELAMCNLRRPALQRALHAALPQGTIVGGAAFSSFALLPDGRVQVRFAVDGGERVEVCALLVGADGIRSAVRACVDEASGAPARAPTFSKYGYYRGLVDMVKLPGGAEGWKSALGGDLNRFFYGTDGTVMTYQVSPTHASFARYAPMPAGASRDVPPEQAKRELMELCRGYGSPAAELAEAIEPGAIHVGELWSMRPATDRWGVGCVTLVGDAAHAMLPTLGQGAGQGIENAVELAMALHRAAVAKAGAAPPIAANTAGVPMDGTSAAMPANGASAQPAPPQLSHPSGRLSAAELEAALRGFEAVRGPHVARVYDFALSAFQMGAGETWLTRLRRKCTFRLMPVWLIKRASAWVTERSFSWD